MLKVEKKEFCWSFNAKFPIYVFNSTVEHRVYCINCTVYIHIYIIYNIQDTRAGLPLASGFRWGYNPGPSA